MLVAIDPREKQVVVVGGGKIAYHKTRLFLEEGAKITVISPEFCAEFAELKDSITQIFRPYQTGDLEQADLILACTDQPAVNEQVVTDAKKHQWVNDVSAPQQSSFTNVASLTWNQQVIGVASITKNFRKSIALRDEISDWLERKNDE